MAYEGQRPLAGPTTSSPRHSRVKPAPGARSAVGAIVPRARSLEGASVRGATKSAHLFSSNGQHEAASTPALYVYRAGAAFEFGLLILVTRTRGCEGIGRRTLTQ